MPESELDEIWMLKLKKKAQYSSETVWHFPGEAPRSRAINSVISSELLQLRRGHYESIAICRSASYAMHIYFASHPRSECCIRQ